MSVSADEPAEVALPPDALKQILLNITQNACDAIQAVGRVHTEVHREPQAIVLEVSDTGHGIESDVLPRIFDPFFTTKASVDGVGLGLFTAQGLLRGAGGRMTARNREDETGAVFRIELPALSVEKSGAQASSTKAAEL